MTAWPRCSRAMLTAALPDAGAIDRDFTAVETDTRALTPGALFVALTGERFDGHAYLVQARDAGAAAAVVRRGTPAVAGLPLYQVADPLHTWGELARHRRRELTGPVLAITGQNGKT